MKNSRRRRFPDLAAVDDLPEDQAALIDALLTHVGVLSYRAHTHDQDAEAARAFDALHRKHVDSIQKLADAEHGHDEVVAERAAFDLLQRKHVSQTEKLSRLEIERNELAQRSGRLAADLADVSARARRILAPAREFDSESCRAGMRTRRSESAECGTEAHSAIAAARAAR